MFANFTSQIGVDIFKWSRFRDVTDQLNDKLPGGVTNVSMVVVVVVAAANVWCIDS